MQNKIKGFIFDLDGVITDTSKLHFDAWRTTINNYEMDIDEVQNEQIKGIAREQTLEKIIQINQMADKYDAKAKQRICDEKNNTYLTYLASISPNDINPKIVKLLNSAKKHHLKIALASSSQNGPLILDKLQLTSYFDYIVNPQLIKNGKPAPDLYLDAAKGLNLLPEECVGFEDAQIGIEGLNKAKIISVGISSSSKEIKKYSKIWLKSTKQLKYKTIIKKANLALKETK